MNCDGYLKSWRVYLWVLLIKLLAVLLQNIQICGEYVKVDISFWKMFCLFIILIFPYSCKCPYVVASNIVKVIHMLIEQLFIIDGNSKKWTKAWTSFNTLALIWEVILYSIQDSFIKFICSKIWNNEVMREVVGYLS